MARFWSFDRRITGGFIVIALIAFATSFVAIVASRALLPAVGDAGLERTRGLDAALRLQDAVKVKLSNAQAFLLTGREPYLTESRRAQDELVARISRLGLEAESERARELIDRIRVLEIDHNAALNRAIELRQREGTPEAIVRVYGRDVVSRQESLESAIAAYVAYRKNLLTSAQSTAHRQLESTESWITAVAAVGLLLFLAIVLALRGTLINLFRAETDQRRAEAEARAAAERLAESQAYSEETTRLVVESALDAVISTDAQGRVTGWNREAERIFGWSADEMRGRRLHDTIFAGEDRNLFLEALGGTTDAGGSALLDRRVEMRARRRDGEEFPIEVALTQIRRPNVHFSVFVRDISDRRRIEDQIRASEREFRLAFEHSGVGHIEVEAGSGEVVRVNPKLCEISGYGPEEIQGRAITALVHAEDAESYAETLGTLSRGEAGYAAGELRLQRPDGQVVWTHVTSTLIRDSSGHPHRVVAILHDLSDLRRAQSALRETEERFQLMADSAPVLVWMSGRDGRPTWFNRPWSEFTGRSLLQGIGDGWREGIHPEDAHAALRMRDEAIAKRLPFKMEYRLRRQDGEWRWVLDNGIPLHGSGGLFTGYIGSCIDITDRRRVEDQREELLVIERKARGAAEHASNMKDEFLATLSHELRTPLQAMLGWSRLLGTERLDEAQLKRGMEVIERNVTLQKRLIEDLLDMSRIVQGKMQLDARRIRLKDVVEAAVEVVRPAADAKSIELLLDLDAKTGTVYGDAQRLQQVVWNLLSNAIKFTPVGGHITVRIAREAEHVEISVQDSGMGISPEFLPHVFERFRQEDASATRRHGGLGLGLAIVRTLVELHGGRVRATSPGEGQGATFTIELPSKRLQAPAGGSTPVAEENADLPSEPRDEPGLAGLRVLVVDDERDSCELLCRVLSARGAEWNAAHSVDEALAAYGSFQPNVLVSDIGMPGKDGYELIRSIRECERSTGDHVAAIALTAFARPEDATRAARAGFDLHIAKPVEPAELVAAVAKLAACIRSHPESFASIAPSSEKSTGFSK